MCKIDNRPNFGTPLREEIISGVLIQWLPKGVVRKLIIGEGFDDGIELIKQYDAETDSWSEIAGETQEGKQLYSFDRYRG